MVTITATRCLLLVGLVLAVLSPRLLQTVKDEAMQHLLAAPRATGARIAKDLQQANELVAPLAKMLSEQRHPSNLRAHLIDMIIKAMPAYPMVEGVGVAFEPNAFDGAVSLFRLSPGCASSGRYIPFLTFENGAPFIDTTLNHLVDQPGSWYFEPMRTGKPYITDPYRMLIATTEDVPLFTMSTPITYQGHFCGVVEADVDAGHGALLREFGKFLSGARGPGALYAQAKAPWAVGQ